MKFSYPIVKFISSCSNGTQVRNDIELQKLKCTCTSGINLSDTIFNQSQNWFDEYVKEKIYGKFILTIESIISLVRL